MIGALRDLGSEPKLDADDSWAAPPAAVLAADDRKEDHVSTNFEAAHQSRDSSHREAGGGGDKMPAGNGCRAGLMVARCCLNA